MLQTATLERFAYAPDGTFGRLTLPMGWQCYTVERPWAGNAVGESCIPEGVYDLELRPSNVVKRTSRGAFSRGFEVTGVPGRTYIMIHPANWPDDVEGCIGVGRNYGVINGVVGVSHSQETFGVLMAEFGVARDGHGSGRQPPDQWQLRVIPYRVEYP